jgi:hypothetical protein
MKSFVNSRKFMERERQKFRNPVGHHRTHSEITGISKKQMGIVNEFRAFVTNSGSATGFVRQLGAIEFGNQRSNQRAKSSQAGSR